MQRKISPVDLIGLLLMAVEGYSIHPSFLWHTLRPQWLQDDRLVLMDTGSFMENGRVSCADLLSGEVYQSSI